MHESVEEWRRRNPDIARFWRLERELNDLAQEFNVTGKYLRKNVNNYSMRVRHRVYAILSEQIGCLETALKDRREAVSRQKFVNLNEWRSYCNDHK